ncbi:MAG: aminotransferase class V-fold PLP-dependent enzyme [Clostridia bacterium]|nr:aminotransferase class V-fold PLP-dependent enzyme [Clostridia bacterium]
MIYFDNAATGGRKPDCVLNAVKASIQVCANPGRSGHKRSLACAQTVHDCRHALHAYFDNDSFDRVIFTKNCTEALNLALFGVLQQGDHVVASCMEHNSVLRPLEYMRKTGKITYSVCGLTADGQLDFAKLTSLLQPNTKLVAITSASNVTGAMPDLKKIRTLLPSSTLLLVDGAQGGGHIPLKMRQLGIDLLSLAGHKGLLGIQGSGALLFSERVEPSPHLFGGTGSISLSLDMPDFYPDALEAGTLSYPAICSLLEGVHHLTFHEENIRQRLLELSHQLVNGLKKMDEYSLYSLPNPCGIVAFRHRAIDSEYVAERLSNEFDIAVRGGLHCAPLMHEAIGTKECGLVRVSFSHFNDKSEVEYLLEALGKIA